MTDLSPAPRHLGPALLCGLAVLLLAGCQDDEIRRYSVPKPPELPAPPATVRLLAAIVPQAEQTWFFKLQGPIEVVDQQAPVFDRFIHSVRFTGKADEPAQWTLPDGWKLLPVPDSEKRVMDGERRARIQVETKGEPLTLDVTSFPSKFGDLRGNVDRWRRQIGLKPSGTADLGKMTKEIDVNGVKATLVDMAGPGLGGSAAMPAAQGPGKSRLLAAVVPQADRTWFFKTQGPADSVASQVEAFDAFLRSVRFTGKADVPVQWTMPDGWKLLPVPDAERRVMEGERHARIRVDAKGHPLVIDVTSFPGNRMAALKINIDRWRGQVGLPPSADEAEAMKDTRPVEVGGAKATVVDLTGPGAAGGPMGMGR